MGEQFNGKTTSQKPNSRGVRGSADCLGTNIRGTNEGIGINAPPCCAGSDNPIITRSLSLKQNQPLYKIENRMKEINRFTNRQNPADQRIPPLQMDKLMGKHGKKCLATNLGNESGWGNQHRPQNAETLSSVTKILGTRLNPSIAAAFCANARTWLSLTSTALPAICLILCQPLNSRIDQNATPASHPHISNAQVFG